MSRHGYEHFTHTCKISFLKKSNNLGLMPLLVRDMRQSSRSTLVKGSCLLIFSSIKSKHCCSFSPISMECCVSNKRLKSGWLQMALISCAMVMSKSVILHVYSYVRISKFFLSSCNMGNFMANSFNCLTVCKSAFFWISRSISRAFSFNVGPK